MTLLDWIRGRWRALFAAREAAPAALPAIVAPAVVEHADKPASGPRDKQAAQLERRLHAAEAREAESRKRATASEKRADEAEERVRGVESELRHATEQAKRSADELAARNERIKDLEAKLAEVQKRLRETEALLKDAEAMVRASPPPQAERHSNGTDRGIAEAHFSPGETCLQAIRAQFARARECIDVCVFTITDDRIAGFLLDAHRRGVKVRVITDNDKSLDEGSDIGRIARAGVPVRQDLTEHHMHHKFAVFDQSVVLTGSYNWTRGAANFNAENIVVTDEPRLIAAFGKQFERLWENYATR